MNVALYIAPKSATLLLTLLPSQTREEDFFPALPIRVLPDFRHGIAPPSCTVCVRALWFIHFIYAFEMY